MMKIATVWVWLRVIIFKGYSLQMQQSWFVDALATISSMGVSACLVSPIQVLKLRLQCSHTMVKAGLLQQKYQGIRDCIRRISKDQGWRGFFKGNATSIIKSGASSGLTFGTNLFIHELNRSFYSNGSVPVYAMGFINGFISGVVPTALVYPLEYARTRLTNNVPSIKTGQPRFNGLMHSLTHTLETDGVRGLYRGFLVSCLGIASYRAFYFGLSDSVYSLFPFLRQAFIPLRFLVGMAVTMTAGLMTYPLDTVCRRLMMSSCEEHKHKGMMDCASSILKEEGARGFFGGGMVTIAKGLIGAGTLIMYDEFKMAFFGGYEE